MSQKLIVLLCSSLCMVCTSWAASPITNQQQKTRSKVVSQTSRIDSASRKSRPLLADRLEFKNKVTKPSDKANAEMREAEKRAALHQPAIDLYGEDSWGDRVNPIAGLDIDIPATYSIDCSEFKMPLKGDRRPSSNYGYRRRFGRMHYGIDIPLQTGDSIFSAFDGKVRVCGYDRSGYGHYVIVRHPNGLETIYGHMSRVIAKENQIVRAGEPLGLGGSTGRSTGPHLHFECRFLGKAINPGHLFDFELGVPLRDEYAFYRGAIDAQNAARPTKARSTYARKGSAKKQANNAPKTYRIKKGDTLSEIAKRNGTTVSKLQKLNAGIKSKGLKLNQAIRIK